MFNIVGSVKPFKGFTWLRLLASVAKVGGEARFGRAGLKGRGWAT
jgi:hypothetical protein